MSLKGKTLFITGASRGIGLAIALKAARDGANIAIAAKTADPNPKLPGTIFSAAEEIERASRQEHTPLPDDLDYGSLAGLSNEVRQQLAAVRPATVGQAARVPGVTPAAVSILLVHLRRHALTAEPDVPSPNDPPDSHLAEDRMDILATGEGMPETG